MWEITWTAQELSASQKKSSWSYLFIYFLIFFIYCNSLNWFWSVTQKIFPQSQYFKPYHDHCKLYLFVVVWPQYFLISAIHLHLFRVSVNSTVSRVRGSSTES